MFKGLFEEQRTDNEGRPLSYPPPNKLMMAPVSVLGGGAEEPLGAGKLNNSAGEGKVEIRL